MSIDARQRRLLLAHPAGWIATGFGAGLSPWAPGTVGSAAALLPWLLLERLPLAWHLLALVATFAIGVRVAAIAIRRLGIADPDVVVWDEFVGQWIAWLPLLGTSPDWRSVLLGFALFRVFDVWKPGPVGWADRSIGGGLGVMLDDVIAGALAALALAAARHFL